MLLLLDDPGLSASTLDLSWLAEHVALLRNVENLIVHDEAHAGAYVRALSSCGLETCADSFLAFTV